MDTNSSLFLVYEPTLEAIIHKAVYQVYAQTKRRSERLPIEDDDFFAAEKSRKTQKLRNTFRSGTRCHHPVATRKMPLSSLLNPSVLTDATMAKTLKFSFGTQSETTHPPVSAFPGSIPVSYMKADLPNLYNAQFFFAFAPKTNGLRFLLVACTLFQQPMLLLINRAQQIFWMQVEAPDIMFDGTVLDGELVPLKNGRFCFVVYDCAQANGVNCSEYNYLVRLQIGSMIVQTWEKMVKTFDAFPCSFRTKQVFKGSQILDLLESLPSMDHEVDGLIMTAVEPSMTMGQTSFIYKYKKGNDHTIDFMFAHDFEEKTSRLLCIKGEKEWKTCFEIDVFVTEKDSKEISRRLGLVPVCETQLSLLEMLQGKIVECRKFDHFWMIESIRWDKTAPNRLSTVQKTLQNIQENLSIIDLFPKGSVPEEYRQKIRAWELRRTGLHWNAQDPKPNPKGSSVVENYLSPISVELLSTY